MILPTPASPKPDCLVLVPVAPLQAERMREVVTFHDASDPATRERVVAGIGPRIRSVLTIGTIGLTADLVARLPALEIVSTLGVGYEGVDLPALRARNVVLTHGRGANATSVADHAIALMLSILRDIAGGDRSVRGGSWRGVESMLPQATGKRLGIVGLGSIGRAIAQRASAGFGMEVRYHSRTRRADASYTYCETVADLAAASDILVLAAPGGAETRHMVGTTVLAALGSDGYLVNVARGSLVDTEALIAALHAGTIAGAALDVVEGEPHIPAALLAAPRLVMTPHVAGRSPESVAAMTSVFLENVAAHFAGRPLSAQIAL